MTSPPLADLVAPLRVRPEAAALLFDFDGTLSPTVADPAAARLADGVAPLLDDLAARYRTVALVSGRPVAFLAEHVPASLALSGQYGLEVAGPGVTDPGLDAGRWRPVVDRAVALAEQAGIAGVRVEPKGLGLTLHWREHPEVEPEVVALGRRVAEATGLEARAAKMSLELHPPVPADKGSAVRHLAAGAAAVLYVGDDLGDLAAFAALADLRAEGVATLSLAVDGPELPAEVRDAVDTTLADQRAVLGLLRLLLEPGT